MIPTTCPDAHTWQAILDDDGDAAEWQPHLESCPRCQRALEGLAADEASWTDAARRLKRVGRIGGPALLGLMECARGDAAPTPTLPHPRGEEREGGEEPADDDGLPPSFLRPPDKPGLLGYLGDYEIRELIGRGGMGVVFKAFDPALHRMAAVKVLAPQLAGSATARRRFLREGRAAAAVTHDHVVAIYDVDENEGLPYLVMQYVAGASLQEKLDREGPPPVVDLLRIGMQVAAGLAAAHAQGLIHRDIKPANILLENGVQRVKVADFGLARGVDDAGCTRSGVVTGTPAYMAPEQARGEPPDPRADLFSLGSVLYALCTGEPPYRAGSPLAVIRRVADEPPPRVRTVNPDIPEWLEEIVSKLHAMDPARRFGSAAEVADLLARHLAHLQQPAVMPRPPRLAAAPPERRRPRRRRWLFAAAALAALSAAFTVSALGLPTPHGALPEGASADPPAPQSGGTVLRTSRALWTWAGDSSAGVSCGAMSADGKTLLIGAWGSTVRVFDLDAGKETKTVPGLSSGLRGLALAPDGKTYATGSADKLVRVWDLDAGKPVQTFDGYSGRIMAVAFSPDGKALASAGGDFGKAGELKVWDLATGKEKVQAAPFARELWGVAWSPDGKSLAVAVGDGTAQVVDATTGKTTATFSHADYARRVAFSPDGKTLAAAYGDGGFVTLWDLDTNKQRASFQAHAGSIHGLSFGPDGKQLLTCGADETAVVWKVGKTQVEPIYTLRGHQGTVTFAAFSPDGKTVATGGGADKTARLWNVGPQE